MQLLDIGGTAIGVLKEGVFFNKTYKDLRKHLIENYNVREVISVPQDQFENTSTKTSILIFDNTEEKTTEVIFSELLIERYTEDKFGEIEDCIYIFENKGDIKQINCIQVSKATKADLLSNANISLNMKDYIKKEIIVGEGYELVKLGDICEFLPNTFKRPATHKLLNGIYNFYSSGNEILKCNTLDFNKLSVIIGHSGNGSLFIDDKFSVLGTSHILHNSDNIIMYYIYYILLSSWDLFYNLSYRGSTVKNTNEQLIRGFKVPIPKSPLKMKEWVDKISTPYNERLSKQDEIKKLEAFVQDRIKEIELKEECEEVELGSVCEILPGVKHCTNISKNTGKYKFYNSSQDSNLFVDFCEIKKESIIIGQGGNINIHYDKYFTPSKHVSVLQSIKSDYNELKYCYRFIKNSLSSFITNGSTINWLNKENIKKFKILLPKNKQLIQDLEPTFQRIEILQDEVKASDTLYKNLIRELSLEALPQQSEVIAYIESKESESQSDIQETESKEPESHTESQPEPQAEPIIPTISTTGCPYIPSRGKNKGIPCGIKSKNGNLYCRTHNKLSSSSDS
jgi:restriction endonuclease S subunit